MSHHSQAATGAVYTPVKTTHYEFFGPIGERGELAMGD